MSAHLAVQDVSVVYAGEYEDRPALQSIRFTVAPGEFVCMVGASGGGKSTLIRTIAGLIPPTNGQILIDGVVLTAPTRRIALMFQEANLMPWRRVWENIALPLELEGIGEEVRIEAARTVLNSVRLGEEANAYPGQLSGGMAQRVALGRVLIQKPDILLLDEPFGALDALTREGVSNDLLRLWAAQGHTVLMVTHDIDEAVALADRILVLSARPGRISADIPIALSRPRDRYDARFGKYVHRVRGALGEAQAANVALRLDRGEM